MSNKTPVYATTPSKAPPATAGGLGEPKPTMGTTIPRPGLVGGMPKK